ncbi:MAG TPA: ATP-dependent DNA helicase RecG [Acidobacteriota bacterium]|nr:ATP-dependent DNA helicase RecG [Acidobacteriota bacterium]HNB72880.1 ATP-dependent DNA helicase RecG [Acidobacteriota bacterium]HNC42820.1 ATP-dependent DNA helicase RecG [Acidobacteriota bacterium]HND18974.1 ATP-dependent DNA helicase RecG [Acidobacteriota bacterium]HNG92984.1 ATP-dependent DNA helicase RecG [Acidobacteriota bacterium]
MLTLATPLAELHLYLPRVGKKTATKLATEVAELLEMTDLADPTVEDLVYYLPFRYEDRAQLMSSKDLADGMKAALEVELTTTEYAPIRTKTGRALSIFQITGLDSAGRLRAMWWNQPYLTNVFEKGQRVVFYGEWKYSNRHNCFQIENPEYEILNETSETASEFDDAGTIHTGRRVPIYRKLGSFRTRALRTIMFRMLEQLTEAGEEWLPESLMQRYGFPSRLDAFRQVHFPAMDHWLDDYQCGRSKAHARLATEEFLLLAVALNRRRLALRETTKGTAMTVNDHIREAVRRVLPFKPTNAQKRVIREIVGDMTSPHPMNRLLQGDVGAGKTMVALQAMIVAIENGYQVAMMAPTEILVEQHALNLKRYLKDTSYRVESLTGRLKPKEKLALRETIASGEVDLVIGTQALIQESTRFARLGLVVIDEQHRFGVIQRTALSQRGLQPDVLVMTATPIPRSLAMTAYGDLDISVLDELPPGRQPIRTAIRTNAEREKVYDFLQREATEGRQVYIVFPLVEESEKMDLKAATQAAEELQTEIFPSLKIGLLHGKMKSVEKEAVMATFSAGETQILVSTTVIEVGIDVPNSSVMVIEHPERFGLAQLHQLRGRIGRGAAKSYCILMLAPKTSQEARDRLELFAASSDGFVIAEKDLELRGPGEVFGTRQSGVPLFRVGNIVRDRDWLETAQQTARDLMREHPHSREVLRLVELSQIRYPQAEQQLH